MLTPHLQIGSIGSVKRAYLRDSTRGITAPVHSVPEPRDFPMSGGASFCGADPRNPMQSRTVAGSEADAAARPDNWQDNLRPARGIIYGVIGGVVVWAAFLWTVFAA